ncbi:tetratricopeptide repeat protein [Streptomyces sp. NBC_00572]|uniref:tetratricopeptide repeat protein n=1 Tax=Streptomyces sp. NBC_00572 TaxID=2903664 RepID=UPI0022583165|nr:tetratricopeptide repeat protein [Streptomyces sp. NBC_00572]MCX4981790.1 tetratricopeptide repeat protein [Streptomyces sp. NBC_00572]
MSGDVSASGDRSVAAGGYIGWVHTGDRVTALPPEALGPVVCPPGLVNVPRRAAHFVGRGEEGALLDEEPETVVISGLGGVGKSSLAARWALRQAMHRNPVWWITAESRADVDAGLAGLAAAMQPALIDVLPQEALRERALQWLAAHDGWLLVLDNVTDPADVEHLLARTGRGRVVVTSRTTDAWYGIGRVLALPVLPAAEAVELFTRVANHAGPRDTTGVERLCETLGQLPLAVEIAAAYCGRTATPPLDYLAELGRSRGPGNAEEAVARTLRVTFNRLAATVPYASGLLRMLGWFAPDRIPAMLLPPFPGTREALGELAAHSMITLHEDGSVSVHRLVQAIARRPAPGDVPGQPGLIERMRSLAETALAHAASLDSEEPAHREVWRALLPHLEAHLRHTDPAGDGEALLWVLADAGAYLSLNGLYEEAAEAYERSLAGCERLYGPDYLPLLGLRGALAENLASAGRADEAIEAAAATVRGMTEALGADDPNTLLARSCLATAHAKAGLTHRATVLQESVLGDMVRVLGPKDRRTLETYAELAGIYQAANRTLEALTLNTYAAAEMSLLIGEDDPDTLRIRINQVGLHVGVGAIDQARAGYTELLSVCSRVLGEDHPYTVHVREALDAQGPGDPLGAKNERTVEWWVHGGKPAQGPE